MSGQKREGSGDGRSAASDPSPVQQVRERAGMEYTHSPPTIVVIVAWAGVLGWYLSWLTADFGLRLTAFSLGVVGMALILYRQPDRRRITVVSLYALAALLVLTPVFMNLYYLLHAGAFGVANPAAFVFGLSDLIFLVVFAILAVIPLMLGRRIERNREADAR